MNIHINTNKPEGDGAIAVTRLRYSARDKTLSKVPNSGATLFIRGPIPLDWLSAVARLPGKCLNVAMAIQWLIGMNDGKPVKLTAKALRRLNVSDDTTSDCLRRMERAGLIDVTRLAGQRAVVSISNPPALAD